MKDITELHKFFKDNESHLNDLYRAGKLKRLLYHYHDYLKQKAKEDPSYLVRWNMHLMKNEPQFVPLEEILAVEQKKNEPFQTADLSLQSIQVLLRKTFGFGSHC